jgi:hypothetical protein
MKTCTLTKLCTLALMGLAASGPVLGQTVQIATDRARYLPGETIRVQFGNGPGYVADWLGLYKEGDINDNLIVWQYLDGSQNYQAPLVTGARDFVGGLTNSGSYEVRFFENDSYAVLASALFTVTNTPRVFVETPALPPAQLLSIAFTNGPGNAKDWIGLFATNSPDTAPVARLYVDGTDTGSVGKTDGAVSFTGPLATGQYEARYFLNDTTEVLDRAPFTVGYPRPELAVEPADQTVTLRWPAVTWPIPIEKYTVLVRFAGGTFETVADVTAGTGPYQYVHTNQVNGVERCYEIRATDAGGQATADSQAACTAPFVLPAESIIPYVVPAGTRGTQAWPGALGLDFQAVNPISVERLGVFDDGSDGLSRTITARLYSRTNQQELVSLVFSPASPGELVGGSRFKSLPQPLRLESGFEGVIVAEGYGLDESAANAWFQTRTWQVNDGDGTLVFLGKSRYGSAGVFPATVDKGPLNRYAAGTFQFRVLEIVAPGKPVLSAIPGDQIVLLSWPAVTHPLPAATYLVFRSFDPDGPFTQIADIADTQYTDTNLLNGVRYAFKVRAVTVSGTAGPDSDVVSRTPDVVQSGIAYVNPAGTAGNQAYGGSVGNDFDVVRPIQITQLGVFDDSSDGLKRTISVRLYDRADGTELSGMIFSPQDQGVLIEGSRFKDLPTPIVLQPGFTGAIVASGYGADERVGNQGIGPTGDLNLTTFTGACLEFVGSSRFGDDPNAFPSILDGGPENRYAAGTFSFDPYTAPVPAMLTISFANGKVTLIWTGQGVLESTSVLGQGWQTVNGAVSGMEIVPDGQAQFYRLKQ